MIVEEEILKVIRKVRTMEEEEAIWKQQEKLREELRKEELRKLREELRIEKGKGVNLDDR